MAIDSSVPSSPVLVSSHHHAPSVASTASLDIESWTVSALQALSVSPLTQGTANPLTIPLDGSIPPPAPARAPKAAAFRVSMDPGLAGIAPPRLVPRARTPRDSMRRRDSLLRGEFSHRRRRRCDNDRLADVPGAQPPEPVDMTAGPTHVVHDYVPYHVAQLWDRGLREHIEDERAQLARRRKDQQQWSTAGLWGDVSAAAKTGGKVARPDVGHVTRDLRTTAKRTPAVKDWIRELEEPVRRFLVEEDSRRAQAEAEAGIAAAENQANMAATDLSAGESGLDSEDEEIVFVGRQNATSQAPKPSGGNPGWKKAHREVRNGGAVDSGIVFDSFGDDESSAFRRWLTHSISEYYGLSSRTTTTGSPPRKTVYVGIKPAGKKKATHGPVQLPLPLWTRF